MMILGLIWMLILCYQVTKKTLFSLKILRFFSLFPAQIEDANMSDEDSKDSRSKAKEALLEWVRKKTSGYVIGDVVFFLLSRRCVVVVIITSITKFRFYSSSDTLR